MRPDWEGKAERLLQWIAEGKNPPYILEIHPTYRCNLHCVFCHQEHARQRSLIDFSQEMDGERWLEIVDEAAELDVREVRVCGGGEPMYDPKVIVPVFQEIKAHGMSGYLTTNGTMFTEEFCRMMVDIGWDKIEFSIDGDNADTHDGLRGVPGCFERTVDAVRTICEYKRLKKKDLPYIIITFVVNKRNFREIPGMINLFGPIGADQLLLLRLNPGGRAGNSLMIPSGQSHLLWEPIREAKQLTRHYKMNLSGDTLSIQGTNEKCNHEYHDSHLNSDLRLQGDPKIINLVTSPCYEPWYYMQILHDGLYSPCCNTYFEKTPERLHETFHEKNLKELWLNSPHMRKVRSDLLRKELKGVCRTCDAVNFVRTRQIRQYLLKLCEKDGLLPAETIEAIRKGGASGTSEVQEG